MSNPSPRPTEGRIRQRKYLRVRCESCDGAGHRSVVNWEWLRPTREAARVSLRQMAYRLGFSAPYVSDVERGRRNVTIKFLEEYERLESSHV